MAPRKIATIASSLSDDARLAAQLSREMKLDGLLFDAWSRSLNIPALSATGLREFRHVLASQDQALVGLRAHVGAKPIGRDADLDRLVSQFDDLLQATSALGAEIVCLDLGLLPEPAEPIKAAPDPIPPEQAGLILIPRRATTTRVKPVRVEPTDSVELARVSEAMNAFGELAERYRVNVALSSSLSSFAALQSALLVAACPWFGVDLDAVNASRDHWPIDETFSQLGPLIRHVRVRDAIFGSDGRSRAVVPGSGNAKWDELLDALEASDYHGWFTIDPIDLQDRINSVREALELLRPRTDE